MSSVTRVPVPETSLLKTFVGGRHPEAWGRYSDCFTVAVLRRVTLEEFVLAFYTTPTFRIERWLLGVLVRRPSSDDDARALAAGRRDRFAAWTVAARTDSQILLADFRDQTRSWLAVTALDAPGARRTRLHFGSGVAAEAPAGDKVPRMGLTFRLLGGFHVVYSRALLNAARRALERGAGRAS